MATYSHGKRAMIVHAPAKVKYAEALYEGIQWRLVGPFRGGRSGTVTGVPGKANLYYISAGMNIIFEEFSLDRRIKNKFYLSLKIGIGYCIFCRLQCHSPKRENYIIECTPHHSSKAH